MASESMTTVLLADSLVAYIRARSHKPNCSTVSEVSCKNNLHKWKGQWAVYKDSGGLSSTTKL